MEILRPYPEFVRLKKEHGAFLMVDEAHSSGVIGPHAGGVDDYFSLDPKDVDIKMGTLSKAIGVCGGYIAGSRELNTISEIQPARLCIYRRYKSASCGCGKKGC